MMNKKLSLNISPVTLADWFKDNEAQSKSLWNKELSKLLHHQDKGRLEHYLTSFCLSVLDLDEEHQVFIVRTTFISIITHLLSIQRNKDMLQLQTLSSAYEMIRTIESWKNVSQFILGIADFLNVIIDKLIINFPLLNANPILDNALQIINDNITNKNLSVNWLASKLGVSPAHLSNLFRLHLGKNTSNYIYERKISEIAYDLTHTTTSLADIRKKYGFASHSHFIQFFKRHKSLTPLQYRQHALNIAT